MNQRQLERQVARQTRESVSVIENLGFGPLRKLKPECDAAALFIMVAQAERKNKFIANKPAKTKSGNRQLLAV